NPRQGAGQNRIGLGGALTAFANRKKGRTAFDNNAGWQFGVQRLGAGPFVNGGNIPFQKSIDEFRTSTKIGYQASDTSHFFYTGDINLRSQLTPTFKGTKQYPGNYLSDISGLLSNPVAQAFSPATLTVSAGLDFKPTDKLSFFYSMFGGKFIIVADDSIARQGIHGNPVVKNAQGVVVSYKNVDKQIGSLLKVNYTNKFIENKLRLASQIILYSNYLRQPQNIDLDWTNELTYALAKSFRLSLTMNVFYDHDILVQITNYDAPGGVQGTGRRVSLTQQFLMKYAINF
ncbi:MAG: DUF3078 domain-containing protein, partial [Haliscomenobacter sp.]